MGAALWLLQPLGSEAALWPAALHVPLGLALALGSLLLFRRGRTVSATVAAAAALLSVEQLILALPLAAWLVAPPDRRTRSAGLAGAVTGVALVAFLLWPGSDPRLKATLGERVVGAAVLVVLVNVPVVLSVPRQDSSRLFTPTWLVLTTMAAMVGAVVRWRRTALLGAAGGLSAAGALMSLACSLQVRVASAAWWVRSPPVGCQPRSRSVAGG